VPLAVAGERGRCRSHSAAANSRGALQVKGVSDQGLTPKKMKCVAVLGGGLMGSGICTALTLAGYSVLLKEINQKFLDAGVSRIKANLDSRVKKGAMTPAARDAALARVQGVLTYDGFKVRRAPCAACTRCMHMRAGLRCRVWCMRACARRRRTW
jgi:3-hydroxyacyl-CoA dehydrogenase, NAD binding domain